MKARQPFSLPGQPRPIPGQEPGVIEWNYVKFLVDRNGQPVKRYKPAFDPMSFEDDVSAG